MRASSSFPTFQHLQVHASSTTKTITAEEQDAIPKTEKQQLRDCLEAFAFAHNLEPAWPKHYLTYFARAGITSINDFATSVRDGTVNLDLDFLAEVPPQDRLSEDLILKLHDFLPGPVGIRCFRLAQRAAEKVETGEADAKYVHRPENGKRGEEQWVVRNDQPHGWTLHVDCAGFVRSTLKHVLSHIVTTHIQSSLDDNDSSNILTDAMPVALSDRSFMRAKDFYRFFESITTTVLEHDETKPEWRRIPDLRMVLPGDIIVYRPRGSAAGGAAFTTNDRSSLKQVLKAVKAAQLWHREDQALRAAGPLYLVKRNISRDPRIGPWTEAVRQYLRERYNITTVKQLRTALAEQRIPAAVVEDERATEDVVAAVAAGACTSTESDVSLLLTVNVLRLMKECVETTALNTGHIVFVAGRALRIETTANGGQVYRIPVVHSTKHGKKDDNGVTTQGVQMHFRRFTLTKDGVWIRESAATKAKAAADAKAEVVAAELAAALVIANHNRNNSTGGYNTDEDDAVVEGPDEADDGGGDDSDLVEGAETGGASTPATATEAGDDLAGQANVEILAARMSI